MKRRVLTLCVLVGVWPAAGMPAWGQGGLAPSRPPAAIMKSLDQVEPCTPISSLPYPITVSGCYYLTTNLVGVSGTNGITISADNVTIDLHGFTLDGVPGSLNGVLIDGSRTNLAVSNGVIRDWGQSGIEGNLAGEAARCSQYTSLRLTGNGDW